MQETFVRAWQSLHRYDRHYAFRTWVFTIAYRLAVSHGRQDRGPTEALPEHAAHKSAGPAEELEREESRGRLWQRAKEVLSEEQFLALWLFYVDELPAAEVAKVMNRSWVSVKTMIHRARRKLEPALEELAPVRRGGEKPAGEAPADDEAIWKAGD